jgi:uncharacterized protein
MRLIDTNILLRYYLQDSETQSPKARELISAFEKGEQRGIISCAVIFEVAFTLERSYRIPRKDICDFLRFLLALAGVTVELADTFSDAVEIYLEKNVSFGDAFQAAYMKQKGIEEIYSFDRDFDKIKDINRIIP